MHGIQFGKLLRMSGEDKKAPHLHSINNIGLKKNLANSEKEPYNLQCFTI